MPFIDEAWRDIPGYENLYQASDMGRIKTLGQTVLHKPANRVSYWHCLPTRILKPSVSREGYQQVTLTKDGIARAFSIHYLILLTFVGPRPKGMECCHFPDRNPSNNKLKNLRWDTHVENYKDQIKHGTSNHGMIYNRGEKNGLCKYSDEQVAEMRRLWDSGEMNQKQICKKFGCSSGYINYVVHRQGRH